MIAIEEAKTEARRLTSYLIDKGYVPTGLYEYQDNYARVRLDHPDPENYPKFIRPLSKINGEWKLKEPDFLNGKPLYQKGLNIESSDRVWIVEGEVCVDKLAKLGLTSVTSGGATSADDANWDALRSREVIIWPDNDEAGLKYAEKVTAKLLELDCSIQWVDVEKLNLSDGGDCADWLQDNPKSTKAEVESLALITPDADPSLHNQDIETVDEWDEPILFNETEPPEIPANLLPGIFGEFAEALARSTETPQVLPVFGILGTVSAAISHRFSVSPKPGWQEPINLYLLVALPPGNNKSLVLNKCSEPLVSWEQGMAEKLTPEIKLAVSERKTQEKIIEKMRSQAANQKDEVLQKQEIHEIAEMEAKLKNPPVLPCIFVTDATPESLAQYAFEQGGRFAVISDEGGIIEVVSGLYSGGQANINIILNGIDGGHVRVIRKNHAFDLNPNLTFLLVVQPVIIQTMARKRALTGNGLIERFLFALPESKLGYRSHSTDPMPENISLKYNSTVRQLLDECLEIKDGEQQRKILTLDPSALQEWKDFQKYIETQLRPSGRLYPIVSWGGKLCGYALRLAGLLHVMEHGTQHGIISKQTMKNALALAALIIDHTLAAFEMMSADKIVEKAKKVFDWIKATGEETFKQNDCNRALHGQFPKVDDLKNTLNELTRRNIIGPPIKVKTGGRPSIIYNVNPEIWGE